MGSIEKLSIDLSTEMLETVNDAVASGQYSSVGEVVQEALREWKMRHSAHDGDVERLRQAWAEGLDSGPAKTIDFEAIKRRGRDRLARR